MTFSPSRYKPEFITSGRLYKTKQYLYTTLKLIKNSKTKHKQNSNLKQAKDIENEQPEVLKMRDRSHMNT